MTDKDLIELALAVRRGQQKLTELPADVQPKVRYLLRHKESKLIQFAEFKADATRLRHFSRPRHISVRA